MRTYEQFSRRWHFLKFEDVSADTEAKITARLAEILAIEQELKVRWTQEEPIADAIYGLDTEILGYPVAVQ